MRTQIQGVGSPARHDLTLRSPWSQLPRALARGPESLRGTTACRLKRTNVKDTSLWLPFFAESWQEWPFPLGFGSACDSERASRQLLSGNSEELHCLKRAGTSAATHGLLDIDRTQLWLKCGFPNSDFRKYHKPSPLFFAEAATVDGRTPAPPRNLGIQSPL